MVPSKPKIGECLGGEPHGPLHIATGALPPKVLSDQSVTDLDGEDVDRGVRTTLTVGKAAGRREIGEVGESRQLGKKRRAIFATRLGDGVSGKAKPGGGGHLG